MCLILLTVQVQKIFEVSGQFENFARSLFVTVYTRKIHCEEFLGMAMIYNEKKFAELQWFPSYRHHSTAHVYIAKSPSGLAIYKNIILRTVISFLTNCDCKMYKDPILFLVFASIQTVIRSQTLYYRINGYLFKYQWHRNFLYILHTFTLAINCIQTSSWV